MQSTNYGTVPRGTNNNGFIMASLQKESQWVHRKFVMWIKYFLSSIEESWLPTKSGSRASQRAHLTCEHFLSSAEDWGRRRMWDIMRKKLFWRHTANDVYQTLRNGEACARCGKSLRERLFHLPPAPGHPTFIAMDIPGALPRATTKILILS